MWDSKRDTDVKSRLLDSGGEGEGGTIWETSTEACAFPHAQQMTSASSVHEAGRSKLVLWDNQRDGLGREVGGEFGMGVHMCTRGWFMSMYGETTTIF